ncbi:MAG: hypothetical protein CMC07_04445 [Flavobacteriaceae bacterium]|jgi:hypothetical protein|nr:hypothetical protein [Flavobacteriaceae bacterium]|tara:strand:- start:929 stop:1498 length:570 start_codon:yes stop_codon:yes gene_type:complete
MTLTRYILAFTLAILALFSCDNSGSLQQYLVDKQDDDKFLKVDLATSLLQSEDSDFTQEEKEILESVKKINVVAYPLKGENKTDYQAEKEKVNSILKEEKYKTLLKMGSNNRGATLKYTGEEDAIDELIVFASDEERGFAVFRLLGNNMRPDKMIKLMNSIDRGDIDINQLSGIGDILSMGNDSTAVKQ